MRCPACDSSALRCFYELEAIPVHSCLMLESRDEALAYPKRPLELNFCDDCGFVFNAAFDASVHEYSTRYEETQSFSPRFNDFADELVDRLLDDWDLRGKSVLEIGCGKGEWLVKMVERGGGHGIGIDPGYRPERTESSAAERLEFIQDFYGPEYRHLHAELVACRHTLEHIGPVADFVRLVRETIGDRSETLVFFEVPDIYRVLEEQAFWDIYYEHCSYFSLGSLARLFERCDFAVHDLWTDFEDQYVCLVAKPTLTGSRTPSEDRTKPAANDLDRLRAAVARYETELPLRMQGWRSDLEKSVKGNERVVLWGSGSKAVAYLTTLGVSDELEYIVDINPHKHGKFLAGTGHEIVSPDFLRQYRPHRVLVMNPVYVEEIRRDCADLGVEAEILSL